jgi:CheY-like chemotaxis protein
MLDQIFVLVAEDEELVRLVIVEALEDAGFEVMQVEHAEAALGAGDSHLKFPCHRTRVLPDAAMMDSTTGHRKYALRGCLGEVCRLLDWAG